MWLRQSALLTWPLCSAAIGLICLSDIAACVLACVFVFEVADCEATGVNNLRRGKRRQGKEIMWLKEVLSSDHANLVLFPSPPPFPFCFFGLSSFPPLPFCRSLSSQTISGLRKESVYSAAEACWNHAVFPLAKPTIATPWFAYFPCITRL